MRRAFADRISGFLVLVVAAAGGLTMTAAGVMMGFVSGWDDGGNAGGGWCGYGSDMLLG